ncbi:MAG: EsaB/YukD family protein, partial [Phycicoccus sp.]
MSIAATERPSAVAAAQPGPDLARITVAGSSRRLDVAVPGDAPLCDLLPTLVARLGDGLSDDGEAHGGWYLSTGDGDRLDPSRSLVEQGVRDGARLHLVA